MPKNLSVWCLVAVAMLVAAPAPALRFSATLESIKIDGKPGQSVNRTFQLRLPADEQRAVFHSHIEDFWQSEDGKQTFYRPPGTLDHSCGAWTTLNPVDRTVEPGGSLDVRLTVSVPATAAPGGYWCALTVDQVADPMEAPNGVAMQFLASISVGIFVNLAPIETAAHILAVDLDAEEAHIRMENEGNAPVAAEGRLEFLDTGTTQTVATVSFPRTTLLLDPSTRRRISIPLPGVDALPSGRYLVRVIIDVGLDHYIGVQREMEIHREPGAMASH